MGPTSSRWVPAGAVVFCALLAGAAAGGDDAWEVRIASPLGDAVVSSPVQVNLVVAPTRVPEEVLDLSEFRLCYGLSDNAAPAICSRVDVLSAGGMTLPLLHVAEGHATDCAPSLLRANLTHVRRGLIGAADPVRIFVKTSAQPMADAARRRAWRAAVQAVPAPFFLEVGTSYFDTLAHDYFQDVKWQGLSVEPVEEYLGELPARPGLARLAAMIGDGDEEPATLYTFASADLAAHGIPLFPLAGMGSTNPTHYTNLVQGPGNYDLDLLKTLYRPREVPRRALASVLDERTISAIHHMKVDAEGADSAIVRAALRYGAEACVWPWRLDFEHVSTARDNTLDLLDALDDAGYACQCFEQDCSCYTTARRIAALHPHCQPPPAAADRVIVTPV